MNPTDPITHASFCHWVLQTVPDENVNSAHLFMSDEAWSHLRGFVNAKNTCHWDTENPHIIHEVSVYEHKVGVWCAVSGCRIIGPTLFMTQ